MKLTDGSLFPFGTNRKRGLRMMQVKLEYWRWYLKQAWKGDHPEVLEYALDRTKDERAAVAQACGPRPTERRTPAKSDPAKAQAALEEMKRFKESLK